MGTLNRPYALRAVRVTAHLAAAFAVAMVISAPARAETGAPVELARQIVKDDGTDYWLEMSFQKDPRRHLA